MLHSDKDIKTKAAKTAKESGVDSEVEGTQSESIEGAQDASKEGKKDDKPQNKQLKARLAGIRLALRDNVHKYIHKAIALRREIHANPEIAYEESDTQELVLRELESLGYEIQRDVAKTGVIALLKGTKSAGHRGRKSASEEGEARRCVLLRAEMDALPIDEEGSCPYKSVKKNLMHACGHDFHTANLLGVAMVLASMREHFSGSFKLIFQPAEEGGGGGRMMVEEGALKEPKVHAALAMHVYPDPLGKVRLVKGGIITAFSDRFTLRIHGKKAHTSLPYEGVDAIMISAQIITALQGIMSHNIDPFAIATFSLGTIKGGAAANIVPDFVEIKGMIRSLDKVARDTLIERIKDISNGVAKSLQGSCEFIFKDGYPPVVNDEFITAKVREAFVEYKDYLATTKLLADKAIAQSISFYANPTPLLGAEDFGFIANEVPSCFFFVGSGEGAPLHNSYFSIDDERLMPITMSLMSYSALRLLLCDEV